MTPADDVTAALLHARASCVVGWRPRAALRCRHRGATPPGPNSHMTLETNENTQVVSSGCALPLQCGRGVGLTAQHGQARHAWQSINAVRSPLLRPWVGAGCTQAASKN
jgi:hypothetical protein